MSLAEQVVGRLLKYFPGECPQKNITSEGTLLPTINIKTKETGLFTGKVIATCAKSIKANGICAACPLNPEYGGVEFDFQKNPS